MPKNKKRKVNHKEQHATDNPGVIGANMMPASSSVPGSVLPSSTFSTITIGDTGQPLGSSDRHSSNSSNTDKTSTTNTDKTMSCDINSLVHENKALRDKITELQEQLLLQRETSIRE